MDADACVYQMVDSLRAPQRPAGLAPATAVAIAVPLFVGECLAVICLGTGRQLAVPPVAGLQTSQVFANFISAGESGNQAQCTQTSCKHRMLLRERCGLLAGFLLAAGFAAWWLRRHKQRKAQARSSGKGEGNSDALAPHRAAPLLRTCTTATTVTTGSGSSQRPGWAAGCRRVRTSTSLPCTAPPHSRAKAASAQSLSWLV